VSDVQPSVHPLILCRRLQVILEEVREAREAREADRDEMLSVAGEKLCALFTECGSPSEWLWAEWPSMRAFQVLLDMHEIWLANGEQWPGLKAQGSHGHG
jgi:hypothetical protein